MSIKFVTSALSICVYAGLLSSNSYAAAIIDEDSGLTSLDKIVIDFGENLFPVGTTIDTQFVSDGVDFGATYTYNNINEAHPARTQGYLENIDSINQPGSIFFSSDVSAANFSWRTIRNTKTTFGAYNDNVLVEEFTAGTNISLTSGRYFGFQDILFDEVRLSIADTRSKQFTLDNLEYVSAIPLPAAVWLFGSGLLGLMGFARRRH